VIFAALERAYDAEGVPEEVRANALQAMAALCLNLPVECGGCAPALLERLFVRITEALDEALLEQVGLGIVAVSAALPDAIGVVDRLLVVVDGLSEVSAIGAAWNAVAEILPMLGPEAMRVLAAPIADRLFAALTIARPVFAEPGRAELHRALQPPVFSALEALARALRAEFPAAQFTPLLRQMLRMKRSPLHAHAALSLAVIAGATGDTTLLAEVVPVAVADLAARSVAVRSLTFETAAIAVRLVPAEMAGARDTLVNATGAVIGGVAQGAKETAALKESAAYLWLAIAAAYGLANGEIEAIANCGLIAPNSKVLAPLCEIARDRELLPLAAAVLASRPWIISGISRDVLHDLASLAFARPTEIEEALEYNQNAIERVHHNVQAILGPTDGQPSPSFL
jgi:hypothetical protein